MNSRYCTDILLFPFLLTHLLIQGRTLGEEGLLNAAVNVTHGAGRDGSAVCCPRFSAPVCSSSLGCHACGCFRDSDINGSQSVYSMVMSPPVWYFNIIDEFFYWSVYMSSLSCVHVARPHWTDPWSMLCLTCVFPTENRSHSFGSLFVRIIIEDYFCRHVYFCTQSGALLYTKPGWSRWGRVSTSIGCIAMVSMGSPGCTGLDVSASLTVVRLTGEVVVFMVKLVGSTWMYS